MINTRLFNWYKIDTNKNLKLKTYCPRPFDTLLIDKQGSCYLCECTSWLPQSAGNLYTKSIHDIINSDIAKELQSAIADGSYRYCNNKECAWLLDQKHLPNWSNIPPQPCVKKIMLAIDDSCNLSCPSCRTHQIFEKDKNKLKRKIILADKILNFIKSTKHHINVHIGSDGDPFASLIYRYFINAIKNFNNVNFTIQTNGLLVKKMYHKNKSFFDKLDVLNLSIDGAHKNTYEKLRRGGSYEHIIDNLNFIKQIKKDLKFKFIIHFVVQKENYKELSDMVDMAKEYSADKVWFNRITNWNTFKDFHLVNIFDPTHPEYNLYQQALNDFKNKIKNEDPKFVEFPTL